MERSIRLLCAMPMIVFGTIYGAIPFYKSGQEQRARKALQSELFQEIASVGKYSLGSASRFDQFLHSSVKICAKTVSNLDFPPKMRTNYVKGLTAVYKSAATLKIGGEIDQKTKADVAAIDADGTAVAIEEISKLPREQMNETVKRFAHFGNNQALVLKCIYNQLPESEKQAVAMQE
jgi:hypothetical protein